MRSSCRFLIALGALPVAAQISGYRGAFLDAIEGTNSEAFGFADCSAVASKDTPTGHTFELAR